MRCSGKNPRQNYSIGSIKFIWFMEKVFFFFFWASVFFFLKLDVWTDGHNEHFQLDTFMSSLVLEEIPKVFWNVLQSSSGSSIGKWYFLIFFCFSEKCLFCSHQPVHAISLWSELVSLTAKKKSIYLFNSKWLYSDKNNYSHQKSFTQSFHHSFIDPPICLSICLLNNY